MVLIHIGIAAIKIVFHLKSTLNTIPSMTIFLLNKEALHSKFKRCHKQKANSLVQIIPSKSFFFTTIFYFSEFFICENKEKIALRKKCNGYYDCRYKKPINLTDFSDEKDCRKFH